MSIITLLSDFGLKDSYVSEMKAVILSINPKAVLVDITHEVPKYDVRFGAFVLASAAPHFPRGTVHLGIVDPCVGGKRKPIIIKTKRGTYVGPDNGILILAAKNDGILGVFEIAEKKYFEREVSHTFHGRDLFSPVAAHISKGVRAEKIGMPFESYLQPSFTSVHVRNGLLDCEIIHTDSFGNVITNLKFTDMSRLGVRFGMMIGLGKRRFPFLRTYSETTKGTLVGLIGSHGFFEIAANQRSAAELLDLEAGKRLRLNVVSYLSLRASS